MNTFRSWSDDEVNAFVDGELDTETAARFAAQVRQDLALAKRVARQRGLRSRLGAAFNPVLAEPVPERLLQAMQGESSAATPIGKARRAGQRTTPGPVWWSAAAASVLLAVLLGTRLPRGDDASLVADESGLLAGGVLASALGERISAEGSAAEGVLISLSFRAGDGRYCRTFSLDTGVDGLACRDPQGWRIEATGRSPAARTGTDDEYRQASSQLSPAVLAAISRWQAGDALTREQERAVRDNGWR